MGIPTAFVRMRSCGISMSLSTRRVAPSQCVSRSWLVMGNRRNTPSSIALRGFDLARMSRMSTYDAGSSVSCKVQSENIVGVFLLVALQTLSHQPAKAGIQHDSVVFSKDILQG